MIIRQHHLPILRATMESVERKRDDRECLRYIHIRGNRITSTDGHALLTWEVTGEAGIDGELLLPVFKVPAGALSVEITESNAVLTAKDYSTLTIAGRDDLMYPDIIGVIKPVQSEDNRDPEGTVQIDASLAYRWAKHLDKELHRVAIVPYKHGVMRVYLPVHGVDYTAIIMGITR